MRSGESSPGTDVAALAAFAALARSMAEGRLD
eukprot:CAMPEP_0206167466 /NCGR_PEP_ID=MMETSP1474-20131121/28374_1 /ASSEMBLY_ACC=CAM_ASM_001110 /TAXON_ID=97495 /ORGANISM="Imantonia sp., Strain RCC918" /LENGTH=31 /DNA_ID= /DNA_START= /DNA_END= /DNA_ORIENTATION=